MSMTVPPRKNQLPTLAFKHRSTDRSRILKVVTETIETYGMRVRSPASMQTEWREDYSHREEKILWLKRDRGDHGLNGLDDLIFLKKNMDAV
jgi:hypothetical protein